MTYIRPRRSLRCLVFSSMAVDFANLTQFYAEEWFKKVPYKDINWKIFSVCNFQTYLFP